MAAESDGDGVRLCSRRSARLADGRRPRRCHLKGSGATCESGFAPPESPQPRLRTSSYVIYFFLVRDPFCCSCTDGRCSFIHEGDSQVFLAPHRQHVSDLRVGRVGGMERAEMEAEWEAVLPAGEAIGSLRLFSLLLSPSGSRGLSIMHECHIQ